MIGYAGALREVYGLGALLRLKLELLHYLRTPLVVGAAAMQKLRGKKEVESEDPASFLSWFDYTDQALMGSYLARGSSGVSIDLDRDCKLFWCAAFEWEDIDDHYDFVGGKLRNRHTGHTPACIHVPWESRYRQVFLRLYDLVYGSDRSAEA